MHEELGKILNKGYGTWSRNLGIALPFFLGTMASIFIFMVGIFAISFVIAAVSFTDVTDTSAMTVEESMEVLIPMFMDNLGIVAILGLLTLLVLSFVQSYFDAGAIGMAQSASATGHTTFDDMFHAGKKNVVNLFLARLIVSLIVIAGVIFFIPGFLTMGDIDSFINNPENALLSSMLLLFGLLLFSLYAFVVSLIVSPMEFCLVLDGLDPMSALEKSYHFFMSNKLDVFILILVMIAMSVVINVIGEIIGSIEVLATVWAFMSIILSIVVIQPLITIWWTRFYMSRTGQELYDVSDLLEYPYEK